MLRTMLLNLAILLAMLSAGCGPMPMTMDDGGMSPPLDAGIEPYPTGPFIKRGIVEGINDPGYHDYQPRLRDDGLELFFASTRPESSQDTTYDWNIWVSTRTLPNDPWSPPVPVAALNTSAADRHPVLADDGLTIYFFREDGTEVLSATRSDSSTQLWTGIAPVSSLSADGKTIPSDLHRAPDGSEAMSLFSDRMGGSGLYDIWLATRPAPDALWTTVHAGTALNTDFHEYETTMSVDLLTIYVQSPRSGVSRIYKASRPSTMDPFGAAEPVVELEPDVATDGVAQPHLTPDGKTLYYTQATAGQDYDIYWASR